MVRSWLGFFRVLALLGAGAMLVGWATAAGADEPSELTAPVDELPAPDASSGWVSGSPEQVFQAAAAGNSAAQYTFGEMSLIGLRVPQDTKVAIEFLQRAAAANNPFALRQLALLYRAGQIVPADEAKAREYFTRAADQGDTLSAIVLAKSYYYGKGAEKNFERAARYLKICAEAQNNGAQLLLAGLYERGEGITANPVEALRWYRAAAKEGSTAAEKGVARLLGDPKLPTCNYDEYLRLARELADGESVEWQYQLAWHLLFGPAAAREPVEAVKWLELAAHAGDPRAQELLGRCAWDGIGMHRAKRRAVGLWEEAARRGSAGGMRLAAESYLYGRGVPRDLGKARQYAEKLRMSDPNTGVELDAEVEAFEKVLRRAREMSVPDGDAPSEKLVVVPVLYPMMEKADRVTGDVILRLSIDAGGFVSDVTVVSAGAPAFGRAATDAAELWQFRPAYKDGAAVTSVHEQPMQFVLDPTRPEATTEAKVGTASK